MSDIVVVAGLDGVAVTVLVVVGVVATVAVMVGVPVTGRVGVAGVVPVTMAVCVLAAVTLEGARAVPVAPDVEDDIVAGIVGASVAGVPAAMSAAP